MTARSRVLREAVRERARALGFDATAIGRAGPPEHGAELERWLDAGYAGSMDYLARGRAERLDPGRLLPGYRSVIALALSYNHADPDPSWAPVARYARGRDYHDLMRPRLQDLAAFVCEAAGPGTQCRCAVDTSAVLERDLAAAAGLGWIGKNTNLLTPTLGSYVLLGVVLTTAELAADERQPDRCGSCTACLAACPTGAFVDAWVLDARRCISYLTIEHRGDIPEDHRPDLRDWVFGCDACQEVCPWNRKAVPSRETALAASGRLGSLATLLALDGDAFRSRFRGSAISRAKRSGLLRNVALALGNRRSTGARDALERAQGDAEPTVRHAAAWALERLGPDPAGRAALEIARE